MLKIKETIPQLMFAKKRNQKILKARYTIFSNP
jgi:hypothetical protein